MGVREELTGRLDLGLKRYNHGVRVNDDTRSWGTPTNSWLDMAKEEFLDAVISLLPTTSELRVSLFFKMMSLMITNASCR